MSLKLGARVLSTVSELDEFADISAEKKEKLEGWALAAGLGCNGIVLLYNNWIDILRQHEVMRYVQYHALSAVARRESDRKLAALAVSRCDP